MTLEQYLRQPKSDAYLARVIGKKERKQSTVDAIREALQHEIKPHTRYQIAEMVFKAPGYVSRLISENFDLYQLVVQNRKHHRDIEMSRIYSVFSSRPKHIAMGKWARDNNTSVAMMYKAKYYVTGRSS